MFSDDSFLNAVCGVFAPPCLAEGRVFNHEPHLDVGEAVRDHRVLEADVVCILVLDEHLRHAHGIGLRVVLLAKESNVRGWVETVDVVEGGGEHAACAAGLVQDGDDLAVIEDVVASFS